MQKEVILQDVDSQNGDATTTEIAFAPLVAEATKVPSLVAKGANISPLAFVPLKSKGPAAPTGTSTTPRKASMFPQLLICYLGQVLSKLLPLHFQ